MAKPKLTEAWLQDFEERVRTGTTAITEDDTPDEDHAPNEELLLLIETAKNVLRSEAATRDAEGNEVDIAELELAFECHLAELGEEHPAVIAFYAVLAELQMHRERTCALRKRILDFTMAKDDGEPLEKCVELLELDCTVEYEQREELKKKVTEVAENLMNIVRVL